ncbi:MAG: sulfotransferase [Chloroflexota bacterium]
MDRKQIHFWVNKFSRRAVQLAGGYLYVNPKKDFNRSILVAGTGRSGTTWLGDLITSQIRCRVMFEPFNPDLVPEYHGFNYFQYMRPGTENLEFCAFARKVFSGEIRNHWIDHQNERIHSQYRLIKEIRINLALKWLHDNFPQLPIILLLRHPCAVVSSRMELGWATDDDIEPFLSQADLVTDYLGEHLELIRNAKMEEEKHAIIWSISNLVPLQQFMPGELKIVYYENLCTQPEIELPAVLALIGQKYAEPLIDKLNRPSQTTRVTSAVVTGTDKITGWKKKLAPSQIENILRIVDGFGLGQLYGDSVSPRNTNVT